LDQKHTIKAVALRTGLSAHLIRMWERRYEAVNPDRSDTNRRLYSDADIKRLSLLRRATEIGESIGQVAGLSDDELLSLIGQAQIETPFKRAEVKDRSAGISPEDIVERAWHAIVNLDADDLQATILDASVMLTQPVLMEKVVEPLMYRVGEKWNAGDVSVAHEHMASAIVRSFLGGYLTSRKKIPHAPKMVITTPTGQRHELGALMAALTAHDLGWQSIYVGPDLPAHDIARVARQEKAQAVALSIIYPPNDPILAGELNRLRQLLGDDIPIIIGGRAAASYGRVIDKIKAIPVESLSDLRRSLENIHINYPCSKPS